MAKSRILLVDDEVKIRVALSEMLDRNEYQALAVGSAAEAYSILDREAVDLVLLDLVLPDADGLEILQTIRRLKPALPVIILSGHATIARAVQATKLGAFDVLEKPLESEKIIIAVGNALERSRLERERQFLIEDARQRLPMIGSSKAIQDILKLIEAVAPTDSKVLITGESGTGKELVARTLHLSSHRAGAPFLAVNFAAIPEDLIESELFGYEKGAFTGAHQRKQGKFELAGSGTLFMDEIGDMSPRLQAKILRAIEESEIQPVGGKGAIPIDARIIAASNQDLRLAVRERNFREDLYFRLNVIHIRIPPLSERKEDIPVLAGHFMEAFSRDQKRPAPMTPPESMAALIDYSWPGNVRELRNFIEMLFVFFSGRIISRAEITNLLADFTLDARLIHDHAQSLSEVRGHAEHEAILKALTANTWDYQKTARDLSISRASLFSKIKQFSIRRPV